MTAIAELWVEALRRAHLLQDVPREQLVVRFIELTEEIRREAIEKGTAVDGDWGVTESAGFQRPIP
jgi:hypothetical protein